MNRLAAAGLQNKRADIFGIVKAGDFSFIEITFVLRQVVFPFVQLQEFVDGGFEGLFLEGEFFRLIKMKRDNRIDDPGAVQS